MSSAPLIDGPRIPGLLVSLGGLRHFIPASAAVQVLARPVVSRVPGTEIGITLCAGRVTPVSELGADRRELLVCELDSESVAFSGLSVIEAGFFEASGAGVRVGSEQIPALDLGAELKRAELSLLGGGGQP
jgi:hypothetical protein